MGGPGKGSTAPARPTHKQAIEAISKRISVIYIFGFEGMNYRMISISCEKYPTKISIIC